MNYELKCRHEVCFKAKIGLTGLIVNSNAKNLNCKTTESKKLLTSLAKSVVHVVDRILHCTVNTDHLNYNYRLGVRCMQAQSTCTRLTAFGASETEKKPPAARLPLNIGTRTAVYATHYDAYWPGSRERFFTVRAGCSPPFLLPLFSSSPFPFPSLPI